MRINLAKRSKERKAKIAPAEWQEFIEIQNKAPQGFIFLSVEVGGSFDDLFDEIYELVAG